SSEFAPEFGDYEVVIRMPRGYTVVATGRLQNPESVLSPIQLKRWKKISADSTIFIISQQEANASVEKDTISWHFKAQNVRDFAFAASNQYIWEARHTLIPGNSSPTLLQAFYIAGVAPLWQHLAVATAEYTLHAYSRHTFPFPYPTMSVTYGGVFGMEYPMIVFCGRQKIENGSYTEAARQSFISLVIHEVGHNFFPMVVNSDERRWMWLDEGLNTYLENLTKAFFEPMLRENEEEAEYRRVRDYLASGYSQPILGHPHTIREVGANAYLKVAIGLEILRNDILTPSQMDTAFQRYACTWAFKHPEPWDFFRMISNSVSQELGWFWRGWFLEALPISISIDTVVQEKIEVEKKWKETLLTEEKLALQHYLRKLAQDTVERSFFISRYPALKDKYVEKNLEVYRSRLRAHKEEFTRAREAYEKYLQSYEDLYEVRVRFRNQGMIWPLRVRLTYANGARSVWYFPAEVWAKEPRVLVKVFYTRGPVKQVEIDPGKVSLNSETRKNVYTLSGGD
ncbi:MAG: M1 family aminopeptidase, partial [Bacteroidia bacterium]|nr:M1 family aminopeptidase [Bacteroidia bacterium]MDW8134078.1 M1 family aminopeptidase [Bacteroidia bacterium]